MAFGMSSFSTSVGISAWYAGPPKACANPETNERQRMCQTCTTPVATRIVSSVAVAICTYWEPSRILPPLHAIGHHAADQREQKDGNAAEELIQRQQETPNG